MSYLVVVLLSLLWLGFFAPSLLQARRSSPLASASTFQDSLTRISNGRAVDAASQPRPRRRSRREIARQRDILAVLGAAVVASLVLGLVFGGAARWLVVPTVLAFVGYVAALRAQVVQLREQRHALAPPPRLVPAPPEPDDGIVPSVRRRVPSGDFERIAG
jgi:hypothetical protein